MALTNVVVTEKIQMSLVRNSTAALFDLGHAECVSDNAADAAGLDGAAPMDLHMAHPAN
jgi:hypothetical protein